MISLAQALADAQAAGIDRLDAQRLLAHHLGRPRAWLIAHDADELPALTAPAWAADLARCADGVPLAYLLGEHEFHGLRLRVGPDVLVPRADTETLVDWALEMLPTLPASQADEPHVDIVDLGTGSGAIALALAQRCPAARVSATDLSPAALAVAQDNARRLGLRVQFAAGSWWQAVAALPLPDQRFDLAVSNPPYIAHDDRHLDRLRHEPRLALTPGGDGLDAIRSIVAGAPQHLRAGAWLLIEHGWDQAQAVRALLMAQGFDGVLSRHDLAGHPRCSGGRWPG